MKIYLALSWLLVAGSSIAQDTYSLTINYESHHLLKDNDASSEPLTKPQVIIYQKGGYYLSEDSDLKGMDIVKNDDELIVLSRNSSSTGFLTFALFKQGFKAVRTEVAYAVNQKEHSVTVQIGTYGLTPEHDTSRN